jgi:signal transduction histidine kinase
VTEGPTEDDRRRLRHDLRAPLTIIAGFSEVLSSDKPIDEDKRRDYAQRIHAAAKELRTMLDDLLER